jgi:hypothetical protein
LPWLLDEIPPGDDFSKILTSPEGGGAQLPVAQIDVFKEFPSAAILHEMTHLYDLLGDEDDEDKKDEDSDESDGSNESDEDNEDEDEELSSRILDYAYRWTGITKLSKPAAHVNADNYGKHAL